VDAGKGLKILPSLRRVSRHLPSFTYNPGRVLSKAITCQTRGVIAVLTLGLSPWRAERLATTRTRMASTAPSLDFALPFARPLKAARAASMASRGSDLPARRRFWRSGRSTSRTSTPTWRR